MFILLTGCLSALALEQSCDADSTTLLHARSVVREVVQNNQDIARLSSVEGRRRRRRPSPPPPPPPQAQSPTDHQHLEYAYAPDPQGDDPNFIKRGGQVFAFGGSNKIRETAQNTATITDEVQIDRNTAAHSHRLATNFGLSGKLGVVAFSGSIAASIETSEKSDVKTVRADLVAKSVEKDVHLNAWTPETLIDNLATGVADAFNQKEPEYIYNTYGAFVANEVELGAVLRSTLYRQSSIGERETSVDAEIKASIRKLTVRATLEVSSENNWQESHQSKFSSAKIVVRGGNQNLWVGRTAENDFDDIKRDWAGTISGALVPTSYNFHPLSDLIRVINTDKADAFDDYCQNKWDREDANQRAVEDQLPYYPGLTNGFYRIQQKARYPQAGFLTGYTDQASDWQIVTREKRSSATHYWYLHNDDSHDYNEAGGNVYTIQMVGYSSGAKLMRYLDAHRVRDHNVVTRNYNPNTQNQRWRLKRLSGDNEWEISQESTSRKLDAHQTSGTDFRVVTRDASSESPARRWILTPLEGQELAVAQHASEQ